jgi:hypothetical protein
LSKGQEPLEILYQALASPIGLVIAVGDFVKDQAKLYQARSKSGDPDLEVLQFRRSPHNPEQELWIVKGAKK